jgi:hypothetical protein
VLHGLDQYGVATFDRRARRAQDRPLATCEARLTLESGVPFSISDQALAQTVYLTPLGRGSRVELYDTAVNQWVPRTLAAEISVAVPSTLFRLFDLFAYWTGAAVALESVNWNQATGTITAATAAAPCVITSNAHGLSDGALVGIAGIVGTLGTDANNGVNDKAFTIQSVAANTFALQGSDTTGLTYTSGGTWYSIPNTRATALTTQNGVYVKSGDASRRYLGTASTNSTSGRTDDRAIRRFLWNYYHRRPTYLLRTDPTDTWNYTTAAFRPANNRIDNRVELVCGLSEDVVKALVSAMFYDDSGLFPAIAPGIGVKQATSNDAQLIGGFGSTVAIMNTPAYYAGFPGLGYSYLQRLEYATPSGTTTWYGDAGAAGVVQSGLLAEVWC